MKPNTKLPPLPKVGERRLLKLIGFLEKLPRKKFRFDTVHEREGCGTVACAIGWCPVVFPKLVRYGGLSVHPIDENFGHGIHATSYMLFGVVIGDLFFPGGQSCVHPNLPECLEDATPKQVARMLRKYLALTKEPA